MGKKLYSKLNEKVWEKGGNNEKQEQEKIKQRKITEKTDTI